MLEDLVDPLNQDTDVYNIRDYNLNSPIILNI